MSHWTKSSGSWLNPEMKSDESAAGQCVKNPFERLQSVKIRKVYYREVRMKKLVLICLVFFVFLPNCQKKEEPKVQGTVPSSALAVQNRIMQLQETVSRDPKNLGAVIELGNMLMDASRCQEAINAYQKALDMDRKNVNVRVDMGTCYRKIRQPDRAAEEYRKAIAIDPDHPNAHRNLAVVLAFDLKNKKGAIKELQEYIRLAPHAPDAERIRDLLAKLKA